MNFNQLGLVVIGLIAGCIATASYFNFQSNELVDREVADAAQESESLPLQGRTFEVVELDAVDEDNLVLLKKEIDVLKMEIEALQLENDELKMNAMSLAEDADHSNKKFEAVVGQLGQIKHENIRLKQELGQLVESEVTDEEMMAILEEPFSHFLLSFKGEQRDQIYDFFQQPEDHDWGYDMQLSIADFFQNHEYRKEVELVGATCKIDRCELRVLEAQPELGRFQAVYQQMRRMPWWEFKSTHSSSSNSKDDTGSKIFLYVTK